MGSSYLQVLYPCIQPTVDLKQYFCIPNCRLPVVDSNSRSKMLFSIGKWLNLKMQRVHCKMRSYPLRDFRLHRGQCSKSHIVQGSTTASMPDLEVEREKWSWKTRELGDVGWVSVGGPTVSEWWVWKQGLWVTESGPSKQLEFINEELGDEGVEGSCECWGHQVCPSARGTWCRHILGVTLLG